MTLALPPVPQLQITADDYGLDPAINRGIEELASAGAIDAVSIMFHRDAELSTLDRLKATGIPLGIHLVLVEEAPLNGQRFSQNRGRLPKHYRALFSRLILEPSLGYALAEEAQAQVDRALALGVPLAFINSHQHVHLFPLLWRRLRPLFDVLGGTVRAGSRLSWTHPKQMLVDLNAALATSWWPLQTCHRLQPIGIAVAGHLGVDDLDSLGRLFQRLSARGEFVELVVHPGYRSPDLEARYAHWQYRWEEELNLLLSGEVRAALVCDKSAKLSLDAP